MTAFVFSFRPDTPLWIRVAVGICVLLATWSVVLSYRAGARYSRDWENQHRTPPG